MVSPEGPASARSVSAPWRATSARTSAVRARPTTPPTRSAWRRGAPPSCAARVRVGLPHGKRAPPMMVDGDRMPARGERRRRSHGARRNVRDADPRRATRTRAGRAVRPGSTRRERGDEEARLEVRARVRSDEGGDLEEGRIETRAGKPLQMISTARRPGAVKTRKSRSRITSLTRTPRWSPAGPRRRESAATRMMSYRNASTWSSRRT